MQAGALHDDAALLEPVLDIWREVLACPGGELAADSNFFLHGGDSLQLLRVLVRLRERFGVELNLREVVQFSTPRRMALCCAAARGNLALPHGSPLLASEGAITERFPCTATQSALWYAEQIGSGCALYNTALVLHFHGELRVDVLNRALATLVSRHEVLRTHLQFDTAAKRLYARVAVVQEVALETQTLPPEACAQYLREQAALPFDFAKGPLWRFRLVASGAHTWALLLCVHHCLNDGWSGGVLLRNLATAYNALLKNAQWQPPRIEREFRGFCLQEQEADMQALHWWREYLHAADRLHSWPHTGTRRWPFALALEEELIGADIALPLRSATCALQIETSVFVLTALRRALHVLSGLDELGIGTPVSVRNRSAQDESIGYFVNLLLTRDRIETDGLGALHTVRRSLAAALRYRTVPFPELVRHLQPANLPSGNPWCDILFAYQNLPPVRPSFAGLRTRLEALTLPYGQHPLKLEFLCDGTAYHCRVEYACEVLTRDAVRRLLAEWRRQLAALCVLACSR